MQRVDNKLRLAAGETGPRRRELGFLLTFAAAAGALSIVYCYPYGARSYVGEAFDAYLGVYARVAGAVVSLVDPTVRTVGHVLQGRFSIQVARDCDAMEAQILFAAAVLAYRASWRQRALGLAVGCSLIAAVNVIRLCALYAAGLFWPSWFDFAHRELWPMLLIACVVVVFLCWAQWAQATSLAGGPRSAGHAAG